MRWGPAPELPQRGWAAPTFAARAAREADAAARAEQDTAAEGAAGAGGDAAAVGR